MQTPKSASLPAHLNANTPTCLPAHSHAPWPPPHPSHLLHVEQHLQRCTHTRLAQHLHALTQAGLREKEGQGGDTGGQHQPRWTRVKQQQLGQRQWSSKGPCLSAMSGASCYGRSTSACLRRPYQHVQANSKGTTHRYTTALSWPHACQMPALCAPLLHTHTIPHLCLLPHAPMHLLHECIIRYSHSHTRQATAAATAATSSSSSSSSCCSLLVCATTGAGACPCCLCGGAGSTLTAACECEGQCLRGWCTPCCSVHVCDEFGSLCKVQLRVGIT